MELTIEKLIGQFERGAVTRRQLALSISALVTATQSASAAPDMKAVTLNHVTLKVADVQRTSKFYQDVFGMPLKQHSEKTHILGVGKSFLGIEQKPNGQPWIISTWESPTSRPMKSSRSSKHAT